MKTAKRMFLAGALALLAVGGTEGAPVWRGSAPQAGLEAADGGFVRLVLSEEGYAPDLDAVGAPALPRKTILFALPDFSRVTDVTVEAKWERLADGVRIVPVAESVRVGEESVPAEPEAAIYGGAGVYPASAATTGAVERMCGVRVLPVTVSPFRWHPAAGLLERAVELSVRVAFGEDGERSYVISPAMLESVRAAVVNPADVAGEAGRVARALRASGSPAANAAEKPEKVDYLLLSPPDFVSDWEWYVARRKEVHPTVRFKVVNTFDIYAAHPYPTETCRNAAESIHAYLRDNWKTMGFSYVVLGGAWIDAQNRKKTTSYFYGGEMMSITNCVPGVYGYPREDWREIPSDMFYACLDLIGDQRYPWDANENSVYIDQGDCSKNDLRPDVCVTRLTLNPYRPNGLEAYNRHELVTNYVAKLARGESKFFEGHFRYGLSPDSTGSRRSRVNGERMYYDELEFYDNMYNMADPRHSTFIEDNEVEPRRRIKDQFAKWRPVLDAKGMMNFTWTKGFSDLSSAIRDYYAGNRDYGFVYSHGWAQGATHFQAGQFATCEGLTLLNGSNGPCDTGYVDYYVTMNGKPVLQYNLGDSGVTNPKGGALASINNTRWGWAGGSHTGLDFDSSMSYFMLNRSLVGFNQLYLDVGHAWYKGVSDYAAFGFTQGGGTHTWTLTEQICYGDPLVRLPAPEDRLWTGGTKGVWDGVAANWADPDRTTNTYYSASNVLFVASAPSEIEVADLVGALTVTVTNEANGAIAFTGAEGGNLRVMRRMDVTGGDVAFAVRGGIGHEGLVFHRAEGQERDGELSFSGTNDFYLAKAMGASRIVFKGGGVKVDADLFPTPAAPLVFAGTGAEKPPAPNELRSYRAGGLRRFGPLAITNSFVKLSTADAFGREETPLTHTLVDSTLEIAANAFYEWKGCYRQTGYAENLNAVFDVAGESALTSTIGGLWTVSRTTTFNLARGARLTLSAESEDRGGRIVFNGEGETVLDVPLANALSGDVTVGAGVKLVLDALPLANVRSLTVAEGASLVLPHSRSGYWQILPVSATFSCAKGVAVYEASDPEHPLDGTPSATGSFFKRGALYTWDKPEGDWDGPLTILADKIVFSDVAGGVSVVRVTTNVAPSFAYFENATTAYRLERGTAGATATFDSLVLSGVTRFELPTFVREYVTLASGTNAFSRIVSPVVTVAKDAALLLTGSHWTTFKLAEGALLRAEPDAFLDWNADTTLDFPEDGKVVLDVSALELTEKPVKIIGGEGHVWTHADFARFSLNRAEAELRVVDGALCVVAGSGLSSPYALTFGGKATWNEGAWTANGAPFGKNWSACTLDQSAEVILQPTNETNEIVVDCEVVADTLTVACASNQTLEVTGGPLAAATVDLADAAGETDLRVALGSASVLCPTNAASVCRLSGDQGATLSLRGGTVCLERTGSWILAAGSQGTLEIAAPTLAQSSRIAILADGFTYPNGNFEVVVRKADGTIRTDCTVSKTGSELWLTPPAIRATAPAGTNDFTALVWKDADGNDAIVTDWSLVSAVTLEAETGAVLTSATHFADFPVRLALEGSLTLSGGGLWKPEKLTGSGALALTDGFTMDVDLSNDTDMLNGRRIRIDETAFLCVRHGGDNRNLSDQNWSGVTGTGSLAFLGGTGKWISPPRRRFADTLSFHSEVDLVLTEDVSRSAPFAIRDFSGTGWFRMDWNAQTHLRTIRTVQTRVSEYSGRISAKAGERNAELVVASDDETASTNKALILSGTAIAAQPLTIETNGCVILTGSWKGSVTVSGILAVTNESVTNGMAIAYADGGRLLVLDAVPRASAFEPYDPEEHREPTPPKEPTVLYATVPAGETRWSLLDWRGADGAKPDAIDWAEVDGVTLGAAEAGARAVFDRTAFTGALTLVEGVALETHGLPGFVLQAAPTGSVAVVYEEEPLANAILVKTADDFAYDAGAFAVTLRDRFGDGTIVPASVAWKAGGFYLLVQAIDNPSQSYTFDGSTYKTLSGIFALIGATENAAYFEKSRSGEALTGCTPYFKDGWSVTSAWSLNIVARMPAGTGGTIFCLGKGRYADRGLVLASAGEDRAAVYALNGGTARVLIAADVPFSTRQFHSYAIVSDGERITFYVDGALAGSAEAKNYPSDGNAQFFTLHSAGVSGLSAGTSGAIDDWRLYSGTALTAESVKGIAREFAPWPECRTATVVTNGTSFAGLDWSDGDEAMPRLLNGCGGSLVLSEPLTMDVPLRTGGSALTLSFGSEAVLYAEGGLVASSPLVLDVSAVDGTNLAAKAVAGAPFSRWLVRGTVRGDVRVTGLPAVPSGYHIEVETLSQQGVRLIVTAPRIVRFGSVSVNYAGGRDNKTFDSAAAVAANAAYASLDHGAHARVGSLWNDLAAVDGESTVSKYVDADGNVRSDGTVRVVTAQVKNPYNTGKSEGDRILYGYADDSLNPLITVSNIPFATFRVIVYRATDTEGTTFSSVRIGATAAEAVAYYGPTANDSVGGVTVSGQANVTWGDSDIRAHLAEGVNYVVSDVITGSAGEATCSIQSPKHGGRACVAAFQIVEVGRTMEVSAVDYTARLTGEAVWQNGAGDGLSDFGPWQNDPVSTITLTTAVSSASLSFDTAVTAEVLRVVSSAGQATALGATVGATAIDELDFTAAAGRVDVEGSLGATRLLAGADTRYLGSRDALAFTVGAGQCLSLPAALGWGADDAIAAGGLVRFTGSHTFATTPVKIAGAIVRFEDAFVKRTAEEYSVLRADEGDSVTFDANNGTVFNVIDVRGGHLVITNSASQKVLYFGGAANGAANSTITVSGGTLTMLLSGRATDNKNCGFLLSTTASAWATPAVRVTGGTFDLSGGQFTLWEKSTLTVEGGVFRAYGVKKTAGGSSSFAISGGTVEIGAGGIGPVNGKALPLTLSGGRIVAVADATVSSAPNVIGRTELRALTGHTLTLSAGASGSGTLVCGGTEGEDGAISLTGGDYSGLTIGGRFTLALTAAQSAATADQTLFLAADGFDLENLTLVGTDGRTAATGGSVRRDGTRVVWTPDAACVTIEREEGVVKVPHVWLTDRQFVPADLAADPSLKGVNGVALWASYLMGLEPTNACDNLDCAIDFTAEGRVRLQIPSVTGRTGQRPTAARIRYVLQTKERLSDNWQDHATSDSASVECEKGEAPARFYRYRIEF